ncbi:4'-phosphopantetheinyl transferase family protein [Sulfitobacter donghicola]|uniref:Enterobactin synthase component D n=1 Tax=Sulfitobacter donghicola DSW-25 = KCTC 12864 = JCM 14565 TaxID=1300350 RepID=A0A073II64_9RHOB|nr:4'-phosphopantetheinyl transferase superfamily protein [Sulfitobacter donghicola]KEJ89260.1 phosphopantetheinyl transferase [Sulfitobacter donghicola DSW-25 = KCTC 12864 = JCM 14565]KIN69056.1 4'-phosphopantetheinyl transferase [Sulfitobacter donghicola DSW-25 = KCTC 12864 = JCM 14565]
MTEHFDPELVKGLTESVLPKGLSVAARNPRQMPMATEPQESVAVKGAVPSRLSEFHAGRAAARSAMVGLGLPPRPVPMGPDRAPIWPDGLTGSISHSEGACVAAVGEIRDWAGIGVDLEEATGLDPLLVAEICTKSEQIWLGTQPASERNLLAKLIFSAKEAAYKAQYSITGSLFGFQTLELVIDRDESRFQAVFLTAQGGIPAGSILAGSYVYAAGLLVTGVTVRQSEREQLLGA